MYERGACMACLFVGVRECICVRRVGVCFVCSRTSIQYVRVFEVLRVPDTLMSCINKP